MPSARAVVDWLLEADQPSVRYLTLRDVLGRPESDPDVREAKRAIPHEGWAADLLARRAPNGWWHSEKSLYTPKYISTHWNLLVLADLGVTRATPAIRQSCELWMTRFALRGGGVGGNSKGTGHHCVVGNMTAALARMGYADDPRIRRSLEWLVETAHPRGGWSCWGGGRQLDSWEGLAAFAAVPRSKWTAAMGRCVDAAAEFFLERELHRQGARYAPWFRFHYPIHYYYDLLVGLDLLTSLGHSDDRRLGFAMDQLRRKRRPDGRWNLDAVHPDVVGPIARFHRDHPAARPTPLALEEAGRPSKMITLRALRVLARVDGTN